MPHEESDIATGKLHPVWLNIPRRAIWWLLACVTAGLVLSGGGASLSVDGWRRFQLAWLVSFAFVASLSLGCLFFVILQHLTRAGWSVLVRRPAEIFAMNMVSVAVLALPVAWFVSRGELYPWAAADLPAQTGADGSLAGIPPLSAERAVAGQRQTNHSEGHGPVVTEGMAQASAHVSSGGPAFHGVPTGSKRTWLSRRWFLVRMAAWLGIWTLIAWWYFDRSRRMDSGSGARESRCLERASGPAMLALALSLSFASYDWLMSLDPHWYSTMFGVYFFAGCAVGGFSLLGLTVMLLERGELVPPVLSVEHRCDLGRFLFAFVFFWGYIAFSQYMLIWYANLPETTRWYAARGASLATGHANSWGWLLLILLFGHFLIPFAGLMSRHVKANRKAMYFWTAWMLAMHWLDLVWLVMPELGPRLAVGPIELGTFLAVVAFWLLGASWIATRTSLLPVGDPRLDESLRITAAY